MRLSVDPNIIADDEILDIIFQAHAEDSIGMLCETVARTICRTLLLAADHTGIPVRELYNTSLDLKMRFKMPAADDLEEFLWEEE